VQDQDPMGELLRITRSATIFDDIANLLIRRVRAAMCVPSRTDEETEAQFDQLRAKLDAFFPRFREIYTGLLAAHLQEQPERVVESLRGAALQRYFAASASIDRSLTVELERLAAEMVKSAYSTPAN
jgi:hypothetical protein